MRKLKFLFTILAAILVITSSFRTSKRITPDAPQWFEYYGGMIESALDPNQYTPSDEDCNAVQESIVCRVYVATERYLNIPDATELEALFDEAGGLNPLTNFIQAGSYIHGKIRVTAE